MNRDEIQIRDPFILPVKEEGRYYMYGTTDPNPWNSEGTGFDAYYSTDLEEWIGPITVFEKTRDFWGTHDFWAPEVHRYEGRYFMFASFISQNVKRGTHILVADSPLGPFSPYAIRPATPENWHCLDGTLFVDHLENPWIVFCHEWVEAHDGEIWARRLSNDLQKSEGPLQFLFKASEAHWTTPRERRDGSGQKDARVTDGPFLYQTVEGGLFMLWSSLSGLGYAMGVARSVSGEVSGPWEQSRSPLVNTDGGHGMLFKTFEGKLMLSFHSPNTTPMERFCYRSVDFDLNTLF